MTSASPPFLLIRWSTVALVAVAAILCPPRAHGAGEPVKPNIIFILADDLGWSDTTLHGATKFFETPHLERLAARGMRFRNAYAASPVCSPTRASILTGQYPGRMGITTPSCHEPEERLSASLVERLGPLQKSQQTSSATRLKLEYQTLAESLKEAGYATGHFGKWHLGPEPFDPLHQGFDVDVPRWSGPGPPGYLAPWKGTKFSLPAQPGEHVEDLVSREAVKFIRTHKDAPFYLNYWAFSVHSPWEAKPELIEKYRLKAGGQPAQGDPVYAAMVQSLDEAVGRLLDTLDELNLASQTIIVFFSDNGGVNWHEPKMKEKSGMDFAPTNNAPLRGGKGTLYEGGTREPCVVVWPGKAKPGSQSDALLNSVDFYPTLLEMAGLKPKTDLKFDGVSQVPALLGTGAPRDATYNYFPHYSPPGQTVKYVPGASVRQGDWKLIRFFNDADDQGDRFELYNLRDDPGETRNLATDMSARAQELDAMLARHLRDTGAIVPGPNPVYNPQLPDLFPSKDSRLVKRAGVLVLTATGSDPGFTMSGIPAGKGPFTVGLRMRSNSRGSGQLLWSTQPKGSMGKERSVTFPVQHDDAWHNYSLTLPEEAPVSALRLDPGVSPGEIRIEFIRLRDASGGLVSEWTFTGDDYRTGPDAWRQPGVPAGRILQFKFEESKVFPGTRRNISVYVPAQYQAAGPACVYVALDGLGFGAAQVFDNLIHKGEMPVTIAVGISPGSVEASVPGQNPRFNRSFEFDGMNDSLARLVLDEVLPEVGKLRTPEGLPILLSQDPNDRCTAGGSTGGIAAFTLAWERPDAFRRVFSAIGTYVGMRGGDRYPVLVRKTEPRSLRVFLQDGANDQWMGGPEVGDWWMGNQTLERALTFAGYQVEHAWGTGKHSDKQAAAVFPEAMRWLWKDWPRPVMAGASENKVLQALLLPGEEWREVVTGDLSPPVTVLAAGPGGELFVAGQAGGRLLRLDGDGKAQALDAVKGRIDGLAAGADGRLFMTDQEAGRLLVREADGRIVEIISGVRGQGLSVTHDGRIYLCEPAEGRVWLAEPGGRKTLLDSGLDRPSGIVLSPDGLWLAVVEAGSHWGFSYRVEPDGTVKDRQRFYWFHVPDRAEDSGAAGAAMDAVGQMHVATRMGVQVFDRNGRVRAILPLPGNLEATALCFGGGNFDTLYVAAGGRLWQRRLKTPGAPAWRAPAVLPPWGAG